MLSSRQCAGLGLGAACVLFTMSFVVLASGASEASRAFRAQPMSVAPDFVLPDTGGRAVSLSSLRGSVVVLYFTSIHCPVSNEYESRVAALARHYAADPRVKVVGINSQAAPRLGGAPVNLASISRETAIQNQAAGLEFPSLLDTRAEVARRYAADVTPTFFVIDADGLVRYRGSFDDNHNLAQVKNHYCEDAVHSLLRGQPVAQPLTAAVGCAI